MAVAGQLIGEDFAIYNGDCIEVMKDLPDESIDLSIYSPPFAGLYHYSSSEHDLSNARSYDEFMEHYGYAIAEKARLTKPGRVTVVHCADVPSGNTGRDHMLDFPGDVIRLHERYGFDYIARYFVWKDPFVVYLRTLAKSLRHRTCVEDSSRCSNAAADQMVVLRKRGTNKEPIAHPIGLTSYAGEREPPADVLKYRGWEGNQTENKYSQWVWRQYASAFWDDVRLDRVLPHREAKDEEDERHVHPLQLDAIERACVLWSNPGETVLSPFMGVGSEVYGALINGRRGIGMEIKTTYYAQAVLNIQSAGREEVESAKQADLFNLPREEPDLKSVPCFEDPPRGRKHEARRTPKPLW